MGSQILEILRQGVWASLTGGWFYDPHQDVFCNTFHLYIWLFLLCFPFTIYLYFPLTFSTWTIYCGSVAILFTVVKFANHALHKMFDTSEYIQESVAEDDLPVSEKKRAQALGTKTVREDEGMEMQVFSGSKQSSVAPRRSSFNDQSDPDSIESFEIGARAVSSTIDLKVDVHRKNSSESSEETCLKKNDLDKTKKDEDDNLLLKHSDEQFHKNDLRLKIDAVMQDSDFELSQSDCHIAKFRQEVMDTISECQISQSDNHIASIRQNVSTPLKIKEDDIEVNHTEKKYKKQTTSRDEKAKKRSNTSLYREKILTDKILNPNASCSVLTLNPKEQVIKNTGSLELPLKDDSLSPLEKGLLYWKQQNLESDGSDSIKKDNSILNPQDELQFRSETNISTFDGKNSRRLPKLLTDTDPLADNFNTSRTLKLGCGDADKTLKFSKTESSLNKLPPYCIYNSEQIVSTSNLNDKLELQILEENFDWDYKDCDKLNRSKVEKKLIKYGSDDKNIDKCNRLKFQVDSDDSSDNCGSRSPLLCRHQSLEKDSKSMCKNSKAAGSSFSDEVKNRHVITRTLSIDERCSKLYNENSDCDKSNEEKKIDWKKRHKSIGKREKFHHGNKKLTLTIPIEVDDVRPVEETNRNKNEDVLSLSNERVGLDWLFEHTDSETEAPATNLWKYTYSEDSDSASLENMYTCDSTHTDKSEDSARRQSQGAIPKRIVKVSDERKTKSSKSKVPRNKERVKYYSDETINLESTERIKKCERENCIIDEEDISTSQERNKDIHEDRKSSANGSSSSSTTEISSLLPVPLSTPQEDIRKSKKLKESDVLMRCKADEQAKKITVQKAEDMQLSPVSEDSAQAIDGNDVSSTGSNSEIGSLLPPPCTLLLATFLATRKDVPAATAMPGIDNCVQEEDDEVVLRNNPDVSQVVPNLMTRQRRMKKYNKNQRSSRSSRVSSVPIAALASIISTNDGTHIATSHEDTSQGAIHCFQDERGNWLSYTFDSKGTGTANQAAVPLQIASLPHSQSSSSKIAQSTTTVPPSYLNTNKTRYREVCVRPDRVDRRYPSRHHHRRTEAARNKTKVPENIQKSGETWDSNINLMSNSNTNSENESSVSLSSSNISPNSEITFLRPRTRARSVIPGGLSVPNVVNTTSSTNTNDTNNNNNENWLLETRFGPGSSRSPFCIITENLLERNRQRNLLHSPSILPDFTISLNSQPSIQNDLDSDMLSRNRGRLLDPIDITNSEKLKKVKRYYKMYFTPWNFVKIRFDRLDLIALFDRNLTYFETVLSLFLATLVAISGVILLNYGFYYDIYAFLFCFTMAGCQYCLIKSVQPDSSSPTHGYNRFVVFSRPIYFCLTSVLIILLTLHLDLDEEFAPFYFYSVNIKNRVMFKAVRDGLCKFLLFFPVLFALGLFPQINTFALYVLEQTDMHVFGGNAMASLVGGFYCVLKSITTVFLLYGFVFGALSEQRSSQHILFSIFCSLLIALGYHMSRCSSDPTIMWNILKHYLIQDENELSYLNKSSRLKKTKYSSDYFEKSVDESNKSEKIKNDDKLSIDKNSQNNLLLNSNPSSNETLKTVDTHTKSNVSGSISKNSAISGDRSSLKKEKDNVKGVKEENEEEYGDPLPMKLKQTVHGRLKNDVIICLFVGILVFGIHSSTIFTVLQPDLNPILWGIASCLGFLLHYIIPQLRKQLPWLCLSRPVLRSHEHGQIEVRDAAKVMWFEKVYLILCFVEKNIIYPILLLATVTYDAPRISRKLGIGIGSLVTTVCALKIIRSSFSNTPQQYLIVIFSALLFQFDYQQFTETFLIDYFFISIIFQKVYEFLLKLKFVVTYIAPWQITWGSAFHAFAQPFSVPHSAMLFTQAIISAVLSSPLNPFLGSAIFLTSYVRPIKFWERDYNTKRVDHSNTRLLSHLERNLGSDDNNLNSIFYEHLTRSLQHSLCGDLTLGRWGPVFQGDCFVLASDYLNCLVHIIEMGNGLVTFQMRGLEFRGTYCQQREVEAISEGVEENGGCCCCEPGHLPHMLSVDAAFSQRWLAWELTATKYVLEGYSISDNSAVSMLQVFDFRKVLVTYYVKSIIFYCIRSPKLEEWLSSPAIMEAFQVVSEKNFVDLDPIFNVNIDVDYDFLHEGVTKNSFCDAYLEWIQFCASKREKPLDKSRHSSLVSLCLALSLMGRRSLGAASHNTVSNVEFFLSGLHALFKGDFRITSVRDEWIFSDIELLKKVVAPGVRMSLKLHQDHFSCPEEYEDPNALYEAISSHDEKLVISHEGDPAWRTAVLSGTPSLLALRHVLDDGTDEYKIIMLNKRYLSFRVIKLNRECVRGLWAGQQQELVFLRNRNPERGSIQNAKQALRNMINSSCDQPIGYPIYVSPLTTSYADTNTQLTGVVGGPISVQVIKETVLKVWRRIRKRCLEGCSSGSAATADDGGFNFGHDGVYAMTHINIHSGYGHNTSGSQSMDSSQMQLGGSGRGGSLGRSSLGGGRGSLPSVGKPGSATLVSLAGLLSSADIPKSENFLRERDTSFTFSKERQSREEKKERFELSVTERRKEVRDTKRERDRERKCDVEEKEPVYQRVRIIDPNQVYDAINLGRRIDVQWPDESMRSRGGRSHWKDWVPDTGMEGQVVHRWIPNHRDIARRSHVDKTILLVKIEDRFVPIAEGGVQDLGAEV